MDSCYTRAPRLVNVRRMLLPAFPWLAQVNGLREIELCHVGTVIRMLSEIEQTLGRDVDHISAVFLSRDPDSRSLRVELFADTLKSYVTQSGVQEALDEIASQYKDVRYDEHWDEPCAIYAADDSLAPRPEDLPEDLLNDEIREDVRESIRRSFETAPPRGDQK